MEHAQTSLEVLKGLGSTYREDASLREKIDHLQKFRAELDRLRSRSAKPPSVSEEKYAEDVAKLADLSRALGLQIMQLTLLSAVESAQHMINMMEGIGGVSTENVENVEGAEGTH